MRFGRRSPMRSRLSKPVGHAAMPPLATAGESPWLRERNERTLRCETKRTRLDLSARDLGEDWQPAEDEADLERQLATGWPLPDT